VNETDAIQRFKVVAAEIGLDPTIQRFSKGTRTAEDAASSVGCRVDQIVKSLVLVADVGAVMVLCSGVNRVDTAKVGAEFGGEARMANANEVREITGFAIGGTPPFVNHSDLVTLLDPWLLEFQEVWAAAGTPDSVFAISPDVLVAATNARIIQITQ